MNIMITLIQMELNKQDDENNLLYLHHVLNQSLVEYSSNL